MLFNFDHLNWQFVWTPSPPGAPAVCFTSVISSAFFPPLLLNIAESKQWLKTDRCDTVWCLRSHGLLSLLLLHHNCFAECIILFMFSLDRLCEQLCTVPLDGIVSILSSLEIIFFFFCPDVFVKAARYCGFFWR